MKKKVIEGFPMYLSSTLTGLSGYLWGEGYHEPGFMWLLRKYAKGKLAVDVGANIGYSTLSLGKRMNRVVAIEPDSRSRKILERNIQLNGFQKRVSIHDFAVSNKRGEKLFFLSKHPNLSAFSKNKKHWAKKTIVKTVILDDLDIVPNFIKMDIEGHEIEVIEGAMGCLDKTDFCRILMEVHPQFYSEERDFSQNLKELAKIGFRIKYVLSAGVSRPKEFVKRGYEPFKVVTTSSFERGIYKNIDNDTAIRLSTEKYLSKSGKRYEKIVRAIMLEKDKR